MSDIHDPISLANLQDDDELSVDELDAVAGGTDPAPTNGSQCSCTNGSGCSSLPSTGSGDTSSH